MPTDNKNGAPLEYYRARFAASDPYELSRRSGVPYENGAFSLRLLPRELKLSYPAMEAVFADDGKAAGSAVTILFARLVLEGSLLCGTGKFLPYTQFPWGGVYSTQFNARCVRRTAALYGKDPEGFAAACEKLGGKRISGADAAYELEFSNGLFIRLMLWQADEEFPASAQILFSDNFAAAFSAEDMAVIGDVLLGQIQRQKQ